MSNTIKPNPIIWKELTCFSVPAHRHLECSFYSKCLNSAATLEWPGFSCISCTLNDHAMIISSNKTTKTVKKVQQLKDSIMTFAKINNWK